MRSVPGLFALGFLLAASVGLLVFGTDSGSVPVASEVRAEAPVGRGRRPAPHADLALAAPDAEESVPALRRSEPLGKERPALDELVERLRWRPLSAPDWRSAVRAFARDLDDDRLASLRGSLEDPNLPDAELVATCEVLREAQSLRETRIAELSESSLARLWKTFEVAERNADLSALAAGSIAALGGPDASRVLLEEALEGGTSARAIAARNALAFTTHGFVAEALSARSADEDLATLERLAGNSRWAFEAVTRWVVAERVAAVGLDPSQPTAVRRRALVAAATWEEREGMELALELLSDPDQPEELTSAAAATLVNAAAGDLSPVETLLLEAEDLDRATTLAAALAARARQANGWSRSVASRALCRAAESAASTHARRSALLALGALGDTDALTSIAGVLRSEQDATVRGACVVALSKWPASDTAARLLAEAARNDPSPSVRALAENACRTGGGADSARE